MSDAVMDRGGNQQNASGDDPRYPEFDVGDTFDIGDEPALFVTRAHAYRNQRNVISTPFHYHMCQLF
ncbi:hypothetical protein N7467_002348 [Penicillium canescens]|nr:hypothetical protein N7467_002348 [Penicillium canescens]